MHWLTKSITLKLSSLVSLMVVSILVLPGLFTATAFAQSPILAPRIADGNNKSLNWSGYAVTGSSGSVTSVSGSWRVPTVSCQKGSLYAAFWAGIDGFNSNTVEQAGVSAQCSGGSAAYSAWYEFYPNPSITITGLTVRPGDAVSVTVTYGNGAFTITLVDGSQSFRTSGTVSGAARSSAECITERPSIGGSITKLANFGTISFGQDYTSIGSTCSATIGATSGTFGAFGSAVQEITMVNARGATLAQPSALTNDGSSFTETWYGSS